jgi:hypothetical protein
MGKSEGPQEGSTGGSGMGQEIQVYIYRWDRQGRKGQRCIVTARGKMNSCRVEFEDGHKMITSRNAIRKVKP